MRSHVLRSSAFAAFLLSAAVSASAEVCLTVDTTRDNLSARDQAGAVLLLTRQFEQAGEAVVAPGCATSYTVTHVQLGNSVIVRVDGPGGPWEATATVDDLPAVYN